MNILSVFRIHSIILLCFFSVSVRAEMCFPTKRELVEEQINASLSLPLLKIAYNKVKSDTWVKAQMNDLEDVKKIYLKSKEQFISPLIFAHQNLWGKKYYDLGKLEVGDKHKKIIDDFLYSLDKLYEKTNWEIYFTYSFTRKYGRNPYLESYFDKHFLDLFNRMHEIDACDFPKDKQLILEFNNEFFNYIEHKFLNIELQKIFGKLEKDLSELGNTGKIIFEYLHRPLVRFNYFPKFFKIEQFPYLGSYFIFSNFSLIEERKAFYTLATKLGEERGYTVVLDLLDNYKVKIN